ncbi:MAG: alpha-hydroxy acid oxidase [Pseudomonadota bacterium]
MIAPALGPSSRRIFSTADAKRFARRRLPRLVFDFLEGGVGSEVALASNRAAFDAVKLQPRVLRDVAVRDLGTEFLGKAYSLPFGIAPMGMCNLTHPSADDILTGLAGAANIPFCVSTAASTVLEQVFEWMPETWFQLYVGQSQDAGFAMADRAKAAECTTLVLTVDTPHISRRVRDLRNGFQVPFKIGAKQALDFALHPAWSLAMLQCVTKHGLPRPGNFDPEDGGFKRDEPRAGATWEFLAKLRDRWPGQLIIKGVLSPKDARRIQSLGADAIWVSNHGGRQLDSVMPAIDVLPAIREATGPDMPLLLDSGIESGEDIVKALALGADFVMLGRPWMYALGAEGSQGSVSLARILADEQSITMAQVGATSISEITSQVLASQHLAEDLNLASRLRQVT